MANSSRPIRFGIRSLLVVVSFFAIGTTFLAYMYSKRDAGCESQAVIQIAPQWMWPEDFSVEAAENLAAICELKHDQLILDKQNIKNCVESTNLFVLDSFVNLSKEESIEAIANNLDVEKVSEQGLIYKLKIRLLSQQDSATVLNNLVKFHYDHLESEYPGMITEYCGFNLLEVARVGRRIESQQTVNLAIGGMAGTLLVAIFLIGPAVFRSESTFGSIVGIFLLGIIAAACFGLGYATAWLTGMERFHQSDAVIEIHDNLDSSPAGKKDSSKRLLVASQRPHEVLIPQYTHVERTLEANNLFVLNSMLSMSKSDGVDYVKDQLTVVADPINPNQYKVTFSTTKSEDSVVILNRLIEDYLKSLRIESESNFETIKQKQILLGPDSELGTPIQFQTRIISPASPPIRMFATRSSFMNRYVTGWLFTATGLLLLFVWKATRKQSNTSDKEKGSDDSLD